MRKVVFLLLISTSLYCQDSLNNHTIGTRVTAYLHNSSEADPLGASNTYGFGIEPYYQYSVFSFFSFGILLEYRTSFTDHDDIEVVQNKYGIGLIGRFNYPNPKFIEESEIFNKLSFYSEASYSFTNYYLDSINSFQRPSDNLEVRFLRLRYLGINVELFKNFNIDISFAAFKFFPGRWGGLSNIGVHYSF